jgi:hypothetical protein
VIMVEKKPCSVIMKEDAKEYYEANPRRRTENIMRTKKHDREGVRK